MIHHDESARFIMVVDFDEPSCFVAMSHHSSWRAIMVNHHAWIIMMNPDDASCWIMMIHNDKSWWSVMMNHHDSSCWFIVIIQHYKAPWSPELIPFRVWMFFCCGYHGMLPRHIFTMVAFLPWVPWHVSCPFAMASIAFFHAGTVKMEKWNSRG